MCAPHHAQSSAAARLVALRSASCRTASVEHVQLWGKGCGVKRLALNFSAVRDSTMAGRHRKCDIHDGNFSRTLLFLSGLVMAVVGQGVNQAQVPPGIPASAANGGKGQGSESVEMVNQYEYGTPSESVTYGVPQPLASANGKGGGGGGANVSMGMPPQGPLAQRLDNDHVVYVSGTKVRFKRRPKVPGASAVVLSGGSTGAAADNDDDDGKPGCQAAGETLKQWLDRTADWSRDARFRADFGFNSGSVGGEPDGDRPTMGGAALAGHCPDCYDSKLLAKNERTCGVNRTGGEGMQFHIVFVLNASFFGWRERLALESIFYHHPRARVTIHSPTLQAGTSAVGNLTALGCDLRFVPLLLKAEAAGTPLEAWAGRIDKWKTKAGMNYYQHVADAYKLLISYKYGGVVLDAGDVVINPMAGLNNVIGMVAMIETGIHVFDELSSGVLVFEPANHFIEESLKRFVVEYERNTADVEFACSVLTREWQREGNATGEIPSVDFVPFYQEGVVKVMAQSAFNVIHKTKLPRYFEMTTREQMLEDEKVVRANSYVVQLHMEMFWDLPLSEGSLAWRLLSDFCLTCEVPPDCLLRPPVAAPEALPADDRIKSVVEKRSEGTPVDLDPLADAKPIALTPWHG